MKDLVPNLRRSLTAVMAANVLLLLLRMALQAVVMTSAVMFRIAASLSWVLLVLPAWLIALVTLVLGFWAQQPLVYSDRWWWLAVAATLGTVGLAIEGITRWLERQVRTG